MAIFFIASGSFGSFGSSALGILKLPFLALEPWQLRQVNSAYLALKAANSSPMRGMTDFFMYSLRWPASSSAQVWVMPGSFFSGAGAAGGAAAAPAAGAPLLPPAPAGAAAALLPASVLGARDHTPERPPGGR